MTEQKYRYGIDLSEVMKEIRKQDEEEETILNHNCANCHYSGWGGILMLYCRLHDDKYASWHHCRFWKKCEEGL